MDLHRRPLQCQGGLQPLHPPSGHTALPAVPGTATTSGIAVLPPATGWQLASRRLHSSAEWPASRPKAHDFLPPFAPYPTSDTNVAIATEGSNGNTMTRTKGVLLCCPVPHTPHDSRYNVYCNFIALPHEPPPTGGHSWQHTFHQWWHNTKRTINTPLNHTTNNRKQLFTFYLPKTELHMNIFP